MSVSSLKGIARPIRPKYIAYTKFKNNKITYMNGIYVRKHLSWNPTRTVMSASSACSFCKLRLYF